MRRRFTPPLESRPFPHIRQQRCRQQIWGRHRMPGSKDLAPWEQMGFLRHLRITIGRRRGTDWGAKCSTSSSSGMDFTYTWNSYANSNIRF